MKNIKIYLLLMVSAFFITSCNDAIDIIQPGEMSPDVAIETVDDLQQGVYGVFSNLPGEQEYLFVSLFTDEVAVGVANGGQGLSGDLSFVLHPAVSYPGSIWRSYYGLIARANWIIEAGENLNPEPEEMARYNHFMAQLRGIRAYAHFKLLTFFSTDMSNDDALGVMKLDRVISVAEHLPRVSNGEIFQLILEDLDFAEAGLDTSPGTPATGVEFVSHDFCTALRARMATYRGQYTLAEGYADDLIASYNLSNPTQYMQIWEDLDFPGVSNEVIFKIDRATGSGNFSQIWASINHTATGSCFFETGRSLFNLVEPADIRYDVITDNSRVLSPDYQNDPAYLDNDILPVGKYRGSQGIQLMNALKIFRVSEMYLIKAEARAAANDYNGAAQAVQAIRRARYGDNTLTVSYANSQEAWGGILTERRIELAFEGHRYIDLKRLGGLAGMQVDRDPMDCAWDGNCTLPVTDYRFTMPIPLSELNVNTVIRSQQNPNY